MPAHRDETALEDEPKAGQEAPSEDAEGEVVRSVINILNDTAL